MPAAPSDTRPGAFRLALALPSEPVAQNPAFMRVCTVPVVTRLVIGALRKGAAEVVLTGDDAALAEAGRILLADARTKDAHLSFGPQPEGTLPVVEAVANVVVSLPVWEMLARAPGSVHVPGAPHMVKRVQGDEADAPLWHGDPPQGAYAVPIHSRRDTRVAKRHIFRNITKATSGPVSRHFNSRFSIPLTKLLVETPMTPNQMTVANTVLGVIAAAFYAVGTFGAVAIGGILMQLGSALDRCDGELARSKYMESEGGAWMDSVGDNITYVAFVIGLFVGYARFVASVDVPWGPYAGLIGAGSVTLSVVLIGGMFLYVHNNQLGGTMTAISHDFRANVDRGRAGWTFRVLDKVKVLGERDQFSLALMVASILPWLAGNAAYYHALFFAVVGFLLAASVYFFLGALKVRAAQGGRT